jgi:hypothetical protein
VLCEHCQHGRILALCVLRILRLVAQREHDRRIGLEHGRTAEVIATPPSVPSLIQATVSSPPIRHLRPSLTRLISGLAPGIIRKRNATTAPLLDPRRNRPIGGRCQVDPLRFREA